MANEPQTTNLDRLKHLRDHLIEMDSRSGDAELLTWAIGKIERLYDLDEPIEGPDR